MALFKYAQCHLVKYGYLKCQLVCYKICFIAFSPKDFILNDSLSKNRITKLAKFKIPKLFLCPFQKYFYFDFCRTVRTEWDTLSSSFRTRKIS